MIVGGLTNLGAPLTYLLFSIYLGADDGQFCQVSVDPKTQFDQVHIDTKTNIIGDFADHTHARNWASMEQILTSDVSDEEFRKELNQLFKHEKITIEKMKTDRLELENLVTAGKISWIGVEATQALADEIVQRYQEQKKWITQVLLSHGISDPTAVSDILLLAYRVGPTMVAERPDLRSKIKMVGLEDPQLCEQSSLVESDYLRSNEELIHLAVTDPTRKRLPLQQFKDYQSAKEKIFENSRTPTRGELDGVVEILTDPEAKKIAERGLNSYFKFNQLIDPRSRADAQNASSQEGSGAILAGSDHRDVMLQAIVDQCKSLNQRHDPARTQHTAQ